MPADRGAAITRIATPTTVQVAARIVARIAALLAATTLLASCGSNEPRDGAPAGSIARLPDDPVPKPEPRSRYGNGPEYEVFGKRYRVMEDATNYRERGVASWYGTKFHGRLTSSREPYDMYAMTAAHKTLPLPTYVRVRNLRNDRTIIVRVNDRGPFVNNRIIDLSYAAARKLDMVEDGTSLVEVTAINFDEPSGDRPVRRTTAAPLPVPPAPADADHQIYVQVGAFGDRANAERRRLLLVRGGIAGGFIDADTGANPMLYRVRIGPIAGVAEYDVLVDRLSSLGIDDPYLVSL